MYSYDVIGYVFEGGIHCEGCTAERFPRLKGIDREGNHIGPYFVDNASDNDSDCIHCDSCLEELYNKE